MKSAKSKVLRVFIGPVEIAGIAYALEQGMCALNVEAQVMLSSEHPFKYGNEPRSVLVKIWQRIGAARIATSRENLLRKLLLVATHSLCSWLVLLRAILRFDAFIYIFGRTITDSEFELWLLRRLGRKILFIYVGSDSRPPYMNGGLYPGKAEDDLPSASVLKSAVCACKKMIRLHERYADYLVNSPATAHFHERPYINWFALGVPKLLSVCDKVTDLAPRKTDSVRLLHSPSNPRVKGTDEILDVVERLRLKGHSIELVKIQGMPNETVLQEIARCDFVVDQLYADTPLAAFATEAAVLGKPAVVGGYLADSVRRFIEPSDIPPSLFVAPHDLEAAIERLIVDQEYRLQLGEEARQFVLSRWCLSNVAERYLLLLNGDIPRNWWCDPASVCYLGGCGLPDTRTKRLIGLLVREFGPSALQVQDKPELEAALIDFAHKREADLGD